VLDSNSVGPELTQEQANKHACRRQNPSVAETPPEADHHREPTHAAHKPKSSIKVATWRGREASLAEDRQTKGHLRHTIFGEPRAMGSKTVSSRRSRHRSAATARSGDLGFSPGARKGAERSRNDAFKKETMSVDAAVVAREDPGREFPLGITSPPPKHGEGCHRGGSHNAPTKRNPLGTMTTPVHGPSQHQNLGLARQPTSFPPSRAAAPASSILPPLSERHHLDRTRDTPEEGRSQKTAGGRHSDGHDLRVTGRRAR
jgi:hypothetical protein